MRFIRKISNRLVLEISGEVLDGKFLDFENIGAAQFDDRGIPMRRAAVHGSQG
jgi:hypothetical protein